MSGEIGPFGPAMPVLAIALATTMLAGSPAGAADECIAAPNSQAPQGSHWYYHVDRAKQRKCWYLAPEGLKVSTARQAGPAARPAARPPAPLAAERNTGAMLPTPTDPESTEIWPTFTAADMAQAGVSTVAEGGVSAEPSREAAIAAVLVERADSAASAAATPVQDTGIRDTGTSNEATASPPVDALAATVSAETTDTVAPMRMLLLLAGALALTGLLLRAMFHVATRRRRPVDIDRRDADWSAGVVRKRMLPTFHRTIGQHGWPIEPGDPYERGGRKAGLRRAKAAAPGGVNAGTSASLNLC